ncbi:hypothetical protein TNCV_906511 [Trichonephila clavipes]|nr:hypothetical protein TNCV_906511 [Trichonephila clavipes]
MPLKGLKKCAIETHNPLVFSEHDSSASKATDHDVVGDETENNSANLQALASIKSKPNSPVASISKDGVITCPACEEQKPFNRRMDPVLCVPIMVA